MAGVVPTPPIRVTSVTQPHPAEMMRETPPCWCGVKTSFALMARRDGAAFGGKQRWKEQDA
jgi:hypothetical protein